MAKKRLTEKRNNNLLNRIENKLQAKMYYVVILMRNINNEKDKKNSFQKIIIESFKETRCPQTLPLSFVLKFPFQGICQSNNARGIAME